MEFVSSGDFTFKRYVGKERNLKFIIEDKAKEKPDFPKLLFGHEEITYGELNRRSNALANSLLALGLGKGSHVAVMFNNCPQIIYSWIGLSKIGAIWVPVNPAYKGDILAYTLDHSDSEALITRYEYLERLVPIQDRLKTLKTVIVCPERPREDDPLAALPFRQYSFDRFLANGSVDNPDIEVADSDIMAISYTSGTTGPPKGCLQYQAQAYRFSQNTILQRTQEGVLRKGDRMLNVCPLIHVAGLWVDFYSSISLDLPLATADFSASQFWKHVHDYRATYCYLLGTMPGILLRTPQCEWEKDNTLRSCLIIPYNPEEVEAFKRRFGIRDVATGYGLSEGHSAFGAVNPPVPTLGKQLSRTGCVELIREDGMPCGPGESGELCLRPDPEEPWELFAGYYKDPEETVKTMRGFWLHTGDMARKGEDGYFIFVDRVKHAIRRGGENISSVKIEECLNSHPDVCESAVVAVPSEISEDEIKAYVEVREGVKLEVEDLVRYLDERLPYFMVPRYYEFVVSIPKTATEKVRKGELKEKGLTGREVDIRKMGVKLTKK
ncbi:MAG: AMP-binding protein [Deltaproteobacteria bacterium]|nr:AMP-binding protein [Deltaproteobacteria bacterium]MBW2120231.1 AMP-binding protein [Deltaproteobacteria bacterium]